MFSLLRAASRVHVHSQHTAAAPSPPSHERGTSRALLHPTIYPHHFPQGNSPQIFALFSACLKRASLTVAAAAVCWLLDRMACAQLQALPFNPQLHAAWHVLCAAALGDAFACTAAAHVCVDSASEHDAGRQILSQALLLRWGWWRNAAVVSKCA